MYDDIETFLITIEGWDGNDMIDFIKDLLDSHPFIMNNFLEFHKIDEFPELLDSCDEDCKESIPVLGLYKDGTQAVVKCSQFHYEWEDKPEKIRWKTNCSEGWYIDDYLVAWRYLPPTDAFFNTEPKFTDIQKKNLWNS